MCKTFKSNAGLGHDCINPKAILQLLVELRVRFIDLLMAFEAKLVKPLCWSHMVVLRPKPPGGHRTIGLTVAAAGAVATAEAIGAKVGERPRCGLFPGLAKAKRATEPPGHTRSWWRQRRGGSSRRLPCYWTWQNSTSMLGRRSKNQFPNATRGLLVRFIRRLAFPRGRRMRHFSFLDLWDHSSRLQWGHNRCQTHVGKSPRNSGVSPPFLQALERGRRHVGARGGNSQDGASPHRRSGQASGGRPPDARPSSLRGQIKTPHRRHGQPQAALLLQLEVLGIDECDTARNVGADLQLGRRRRALVVKGRLARAAKRTKRVRQLRTLTGSNARVLWGSEVLGFTPPQLKSIRADAKATCRLSRGQNAATTMLANAQAAGTKNVDPAFRHHRQVILAWTTGVWEGTPDLDTMQTALLGSLARLSHLKRPWCGATDAAATFVLTLLLLGWSASRPGISLPTMARRSTSWQWRPRRWLFGWTGPPFCGPTAVHTGTSPRVRFCGKPSGHSLFLASWRLVTLASERAGQAGLARHLDPRKDCAAQGRGRRQLTAVQRRTRHHVPPLLRVPGLAGRERHVRLTGGARGCAALWVRKTGSSLHMAFFLTLAPLCQQVFLNVLARFCGTTGFWRDTFSRTAPRRAAVRCDVLAGQLWRSTMW